MERVGMDQGRGGRNDETWNGRMCKDGMQRHILSIWIQIDGKIYVMKHWKETAIVADFVMLLMTFTFTIVGIQNTR